MAHGRLIPVRHEALFWSTTAVLLVASLSLTLEAKTDFRSRCELDVVIRDPTGKLVRADLLLIGTGEFIRTVETHTDGLGLFLSLPEDDFRLVVRLPNGKQMEEPISTRNGNCFQSIAVRIGQLDLDKVPNVEVFIGDLQVPERAKKLYRKGISQLRKQQWRGAQKLFQEAIAIYPEFSGAQNALGVAASENQEFDIANAAFRKAIYLRKQYSEAYMNFANSLIRQMKFSNANEVLDEFLAIKPGNSAALTLLIESLFDQQQFDQVTQLVRQVHEKAYPHDVAVHQYAAEIDRRLGMPQEFRQQEVFIEAESARP